MIDHLRRLFAYDAWANRQALASLDAAGVPPAKALKRMAHIVGAEWLWLARLRGEKATMAVWPQLDLADCRRETGRLQSAWGGHLGGLSEADLSRGVAYVNSKGEPWKSTAGDVLVHTAMHSVHHRGQIAADLREAGFEPAYTDFIHAVRQGFLE